MICSWFDGPLSAYWNAAVFQALGVSLLSLVLSNLMIVVGFVLLLHALLKKMVDTGAVVVVNSGVIPCFQ